MSKLAVPRRLKSLRREAGMTQIQVSQSVGISNTTLSQYESGKRLPGFDVLCKLADLYGVTTDYLLGATDKMVPLGSEVFTQDEIAAMSQLKRLDPGLFNSVCSVVVLPEVERTALSNMATVYVRHAIKN